MRLRRSLSSHLRFEIIRQEHLGRLQNLLAGSGDWLEKYLRNYIGYDEAYDAVVSLRGIADYLLRDCGAVLEFLRDRRDGAPSSQANLERRQLSWDLKRAWERARDALVRSPALCRAVADARSADAQAKALGFVDTDNLIRDLREHGRAMQD